MSFKKGIEIENPNHGNAKELILILTNSEILKNNIRDYVLDLGYRIAGPFDSVDQTHVFLRRILPNLIIFDNNMPSMEILNFQKLLNSEAVDIPVLFIVNSQNEEVNHTKFDKITNPVNPVDLNNKILFLLEITYDLHKLSENEILLNFTNQLFKKMLDLFPENQIKVEELIENAIVTFTVRNSDFSRKSDESLTMTLSDPQNLNAENFIEMLNLTIRSLIEDINKAYESTWANSLVNDAIQQLVLEMENVPNPIRDLIKKLGSNMFIIESSLAQIIPKISDIKNDCFLSFTSLTDTGPQLKAIVATNENMKNEFNDDIASQILTLVGQGSEYHQGLFGPIPIPSKKDITAIIYSKLIKADVEDSRMRGLSLSVLTLGFHRDMLQRLPERGEVETILSKLDSIKHVDSIKEEFLTQLMNEFLLLLEATKK